MSVLPATEAQGKLMSTAVFLSYILVCCRAGAIPFVLLSS